MIVCFFTVSLLVLNYLAVYNGSYGLVAETGIWQITEYINQSISLFVNNKNNNTKND